MASEPMVGGDRRIQRAKDGDMAAFESLHREYVGRTYAIALRLLADEAEAEDAVQEIWVRVWERLGSFNGESAFSTWLHRLATNLTLDHLRRRKRQDDRSAPLDHPETRTHSVRPDRPGMRMDLERAIAGLPDGARTMFVLHEVEGFKCREVAELTGKAEGTVKAQLFRARKLLMEALTQ